MVAAMLAEIAVYKGPALSSRPHPGCGIALPVFELWLQRSELSSRSHFLKPYSLFSVIVNRFKFNVVVATATR